MGELFITPDTHFSHKLIARMRGFGDDTASHDAAIVERWNATVSPRDTIWHLGDFSFANREATEAIFSRLNGEKHFIVGNHDARSTAKLPWASVHDLHKLRHGGTRIVLCHYPLMTWDGAWHGSIHAHGHCHGSLGPNTSRRFDAGTDCHPELRPFHVDEVVADAMSRPYDVVDRHGMGYHGERTV